MTQTTEELKNKAVTALQYRIDIATIEKSILVSVLEVAQQFAGKQVNTRIATALNERLMKDYGTHTVEHWGANNESKQFARVESMYRKGYAIGEAQYYDLDIYYQNIKNAPQHPSGSNYDKRINLHFHSSYENLVLHITARMNYLADSMLRMNKAIVEIDDILASAQECKDAVDKYSTITENVRYIVDPIIKDW